MGLKRAAILAGLTTLAGCATTDGHYGGRELFRDLFTVAALGWVASNVAGGEFKIERCHDCKPAPQPCPDLDGDLKPDCL